MPRRWKSWALTEWRLTHGKRPGFYGGGSRVIAFDAHVDTVGVGERGNWNFDPYEGFETETEIGGRGASDQLGGIVSACYGAKIMKDLGLIPGDVTVLVTGTVQEEDCDGLCWQYIINEDKIRPIRVITDPPTVGLPGASRAHGNQGGVKGVSCHGNAPEQGTAIYKMADIIQELRGWREAGGRPLLGRGTLTVSEIFFNSPSRCAVADMAAVSIDRRLTWGEAWEGALEEIRALPGVKKYGAQVSMYSYDKPSWRGLVYPTECYFPAWAIPEEAAPVRALVKAHEAMFGPARVDKWTFSTNGVSIMGRFGIPCIGFGPGAEAQAHAPNEITWKSDLIKCAAVYAAVPGIYAELARENK